MICSHSWGFLHLSCSALLYFGSDLIDERKLQFCKQRRYNLKFEEIEISISVLLTCYLSAFHSVYLCCLAKALFFVHPLTLEEKSGEKGEFCGRKKVKVDEFTRLLWWRINTQKRYEDYYRLLFTVSISNKKIFFCFF